VIVPRPLLDLNNMAAAAIGLCVLLAGQFIPQGEANNGGVCMKSGAEILFEEAKELGLA